MEDRRIDDVTISNRPRVFLLFGTILTENQRKNRYLYAAQNSGSEAHDV